MTNSKKSNILLLKYKTIIYIILSVIIIGITYNYFLFPLAWVAMVPFLLALETKTPKQSFGIGTAIGSLVGFCLCFWMYKVTQEYTGTETSLGLVFIMISGLYFSLQYGLYAFLYSLFLAKKKISKTRYTFIQKAMFIAGLWVLIEWGSSLLLHSLPWLCHMLAYTQTNDLYMIQTASVAGPWLISFCVILANYSVFYSIMSRKIKYFLYAVGLLLLLHLQGYSAVKLTDSQLPINKTKVTYINGNIKPKHKYSKCYTDSLQQLYYRLNEQAAKQNPELILWTESASPWAFSTDNGFLENVLSITYPSKAYHLFGINIPASKDTSMFFNSAAFITYDGAMRARYDKSQLLSLMEEPLSNSLLSLRGGKSERFYKSKFDKPLKTNLGTIGTLICNESLFSNIARSHTQQGAVFLALMSNDSWFTETRLAFHHFYISRLRAVENRRELLINSNGGYSGKYTASGRIENIRSPGDACIINEEVKSYSNLSFYTQKGDWFVWLAFVFTAMSVLVRNKKTKK
nr:apolipoprotein N-acyltransferase [uncultured Carboxylicivirga sp.]